MELVSRKKEVYSVARVKGKQYLSLWVKVEKARLVP